jgi:ribonuclease D
VENLLSPDSARRLLWSPPADTGLDAVAAALTDRGARPWQVELTSPVLLAALDAGIVGQVTHQ